MPDVVYCFDQGVAGPTAVALFSLLEHGPRDLRVTLYTPDLPRRVEATFRALEEAFGEVTIQRRNLSHLVGHVTPSGRYPPGALARLFLPRDFDGRVLYLDGDTLVRRNPGPVFDHDMGGKGLAGCRALRLLKIHNAMMSANPLIRLQGRRRWARFFKLPGTDPAAFINTGVLLMDCAALRASGEAELLSRVEGVLDYPFADQDFVNSVLSRRIAHLPPEWNAIWGNAVSARAPFPPEIRRDYAISREDPAILHYAGRDKPWNRPERRDSPARARWRTEWQAAHARMVARIGIDPLGEGQGRSCPKRSGDLAPRGGLT